MGEVFLAHDPICGRDVALKQMREEWVEHPTMRERFLREARIAAQLSHPSIIPIYTIQESYYTMPHIEGETLKEILRTTRQQAKNGEPLHPIGASIPALVRIFLSICGAVAYAHERGVLHRDLKPENIIVGKFSEVIILDWGLADFIDHPEKNGLDFQGENPHLTLPGKIPGTLLYMAPERAFGKRSSVLADIYSLGVMLYQILTLHFPFARSTIKEFRKRHHLEEIPLPEEIAPEREISPHLSNIALRCLAKNPKERFQSVSELMRELENYIEGNPEWLEAGVLDPKKKEDWEFQENVALGRHMALTRGIETLEWFNLMVSKAPFPGNLKIQGELTLEEGSKGLGVLFCIPEHRLSQAVEEAYCLWVGNEGVRLYRSNVEVFHDQDVALERGRRYTFAIVEIDQHIRFFLDGVQKFGFISHIPLTGARVGLISQDGNYSLSPLQLYLGSQNIMVNCLTLPDAFLARKNFDEALIEYRKISYSFPGRTEGLEATFRAGFTLLKKGMHQKLAKDREQLLQEALSEFEKLHHGAGAPLEYLGKSLVYKMQGEFDEEAKCLELALRKFPKHPLRPVIVENILSRLHETKRSMRYAAFLFALIVLRHLPKEGEVKTVATILEKNLEPLPFFSPSTNRIPHLIVQLAFWLNKPLVLYEMLETKLTGVDAQNAQVALMLLGCEDLADTSVLKGTGEEILFARFEYALKKRDTLPKEPYPLWKALLDKDRDGIKKALKKVPPEIFLDEKSPYFFLYGCFLALEKGRQAALSHLTNITELAFPPTATLLSHYLMGRISLKRGWLKQAFFFEKLKFIEQLELFAHCLGDEKMRKSAKNYRKKI